MLIQGFFQEFRALLEYKFVEFRQIGRIVAHGVFDKQNDLHANSKYVILGVDAVFEQFDYGHYKVRVSIPAEHVVDG